MRIRVLALAALAAWCIAGCSAPQSLYAWGDYEQSLYRYYKNPDDVEGYIASLDEIIAAAEEQGKVPPGVYAEHGYALMIVGRGEEAIANFEKERELWPESTKFMDVMMNNVPEPDADDKAETPDPRLEFPE